MREREPPAVRRKAGSPAGAVDKMDGSGAKDGAPKDQGGWRELGLDARIVRAAEKHGWESPTEVQRRAIAEVLAGKDVLAQAPTGCGKTGAYALPLLDRLIGSASEAGASAREGWRALVLVPTRELVEQVREEIHELAVACHAQLEVTALYAVRGGISNASDVVVSTPGQIRAALGEGDAAAASSRLSRLAIWVLDEADLLVTYGYGRDIEAIAAHVPQSCQSLMFCATMADDVSKLDKLVCTKPTQILVGGTGRDAPADGRLSGDAGPSSCASLPAHIAHYSLSCRAQDKLLHLLCLLKLGLVSKKVLIFVNTIDSGYRARLFLEHFGLKAAVLNAELPLNSRHNIIRHFNKGNFDYLIATDVDRAPDQPKQDANDAAGVNNARASEAGGTGVAGGAGTTARGDGERDARGSSKIDGEFGVVRGIDFKGVETVVNCDMAKTVRSYIHRVGRTGRAGKGGTCVSLLTDGDAAMATGVAGSLGGAVPLRPFSKLEAGMVDALRYRAGDVLRAVSRAAVHEARAKELRHEILNSSKLKEHFQANPRDEIVLKHDKALASSVPSHLKHIPRYLKEPARAMARANGRGRKRSRSGGATGKPKARKKSSVEILKKAFAGN